MPAHDALTNRLTRDAEQAKAKKLEEKPLNPEWPFEKLSLDPFFFGLDFQPEPPESTLLQ